jgi:hypothetical protein
MEKTLKVFEEELREQIAQELESRLIWEEAPYQVRSAINRTAQRAADIARGKNV